VHKRPAAWCHQQETAQQEQQERQRKQALWQGQVKQDHYPLLKGRSTGQTR
jgi:hypothetical protein